MYRYLPNYHSQRIVWLTVTGTRGQASAGRDALAKAIYSSLFDWLVNRINESISDSRKALSSISILDIYGFESFLSNR